MLGFCDFMEIDMDTPDAWKLRADELRLEIEALLEAQLCEYELLNAKLEEWKKNPGAEWLTMADYEPWQAALKSLELAQRALDEHISVRPK
jgi:DNA-binding transcriptional ArsR family regulator